MEMKFEGKSKDSVKTGPVYGEERECVSVRKCITISCMHAFTVSPLYHCIAV